MGVGLHVGERRSEIGTSDFLNAFFSTIVMRLEGGRWGSRYPTVMNKLYMGEVSATEATQLKSELTEIRERLKQFTPDLVVWDFEDAGKAPPWGSKISSGIRSLSDYFWTADGKDLFEVLLETADAAAETRKSIVVH